MASIDSILKVCPKGAWVTESRAVDLLGLQSKAVLKEQKSKGALKNVFVEHGRRVGAPEPFSKHRFFFIQKQGTLATTPKFGLLQWISICQALENRTNDSGAVKAMGDYTGRTISEGNKLALSRVRTDLQGVNAVVTKAQLSKEVVEDVDDETDDYKYSSKAPSSAPSRATGGAAPRRESVVSEVYTRADGKKVRRVKRASSAGAVKTLAGFMSEPGGEKGESKLAKLSGSKSVQEGEIYTRPDGKKVRRIKKSAPGTDSSTKKDSLSGFLDSKPKIKKTGSASVAGDQLAVDKSKSLTGEVYIRSDGKKVRRVKKIPASGDNVEIITRPDGTKVRRVKKAKPVEKTEEKSDEGGAKPKGLAGFLDKGASGKPTGFSGSHSVAGDQVVRSKTSAEEGEIYIRPDGKKVRRVKKQKSPEDASKGASLSALLDAGSKNKPKMSGSATVSGAIQSKPQEFEIYTRPDGTKVRRIKRTVAKTDDAAGDKKSLGGFLEKGGPPKGKKTGSASVAGDQLAVDKSSSLTGEIYIRADGKKVRRVKKKPEVSEGDKVEIITRPDGTKVRRIRRGKPKPAESKTEDAKPATAAKKPILGSFLDSQPKAAGKGSSATVGGDRLTASELPKTPAKTPSKKEEMEAEKAKLLAGIDSKPTTPKKSLDGFLGNMDSKPKKKGGSASVAGDMLNVNKSASLTGEVYIRSDGKKVRRVKKSSAAPGDEVEIITRPDGTKVRRIKRAKKSTKEASDKPADAATQKTEKKSTEEGSKSLAGFLAPKPGDAKTKKASGSASVFGDQLHRKDELGEVYVRADGKKVRRVKKSASGSVSSTPGSDDKYEIYVRPDGKKVRRVKRSASSAKTDDAAKKGSDDAKSKESSKPSANGDATKSKAKDKTSAKAEDSKTASDAKAKTSDKTEKKEAPQPWVSPKPGELSVPAAPKADATPKEKGIKVLVTKEQAKSPIPKGMVAVTKEQAENTLKEGMVAVSKEEAEKTLPKGMVAVPKEQLENKVPEGMVAVSKEQAKNTLGEGMVALSKADAEKLVPEGMVAVSKEQASKMLPDGMVAVSKQQAENVLQEGMVAVPKENASILPEGMIAVRKDQVLPEGMMAVPKDHGQKTLQEGMIAIPKDKVVGGADSVPEGFVLVPKDKVKGDPIADDMVMVPKDKVKDDSAGQVVLMMGSKDDDKKDDKDDKKDVDISGANIVSMEDLPLRMEELKKAGGGDGKSGAKPRFLLQPLPEDDNLRDDFIKKNLLPKDSPAKAPAPAPAPPPPKKAAEPSQSIADLLAKMSTMENFDGEKMGELLQKLQDAEKRQKKLEKQLAQAGVAIAEDIDYEVAKKKVGEIAKRMGEIGGSDVQHPDKEEQNRLREEYFKLEQDMEKYNSALMLTDEYQAEQDRIEQKWEEDNAPGNLEALKKLRRHMPVEVRNMSEAQLVNDPSPNGQHLPKATAKKFKRTNVLQVIRRNPDDLVRMHPSTLENMRVTGLTLTERRAIYEHLRPVGPQWKAMKAEKMTERKWTWYSMMKSNFKENLASWQRHVAQYGPPGAHPYATRANPNEGCPLIGKQCPLKADKLIDYDGDFGWPDTPEYEVSEVRKADVEDPGAKAMAEALELMKEKKANERGDALKKHYKGKLLMVSKANGSCESMDECMDKMEYGMSKWLDDIVRMGDDKSKLTDDVKKKETANITEVLSEVKLLVLNFCERSGMQMSGKKKAGDDKPDIRSSVECSLAEEVLESFEVFTKFATNRLKTLEVVDTRLRSTSEMLMGLLKELHGRNEETLKALGVKRHERSRKLKTEEEIVNEIKEKMKAEEPPPAAEEEAGGGPPGMPGPPRGGLMAAIAGGRPGRGGGRGGLMDAIAGRGRGGRGGGRGGLLDAIGARGRGGGRGGRGGGRGGLLDAISGARGRGRGPPGGGRGGLLDAIAGARGKGGGGGGDGGGGGRGGLMAAIQGRGRGGGPPGGGRGGLMAAIAARGGGGG